MSGLCFAFCFLELIVVSGKKELDALAGLIETKLQRVGDLSVKVSEDKNEL